MQIINYIIILAHLRSKLKPKGHNTYLISQGIIMTLPSAHGNDWEDNYFFDSVN